jgi:hypothetical protein
MTEEKPHFQPNVVEVVSPQQDVLQEVITRLPDQLQQRIKPELERRRQLIQTLLTEVNNDAAAAFQRLLGVEWTGPSPLTMRVYEYGVYFSAPGRNFAYGEILKGHGGPGSVIGGVACARDGRDLLADHTFDDMVAFGKPSSDAHEKMHLFATMLPVTEHYQQYLDLTKDDPTLPFDDDSIKVRMRAVFHHLFNGSYKDELLARIENEQVLEEEEHTVGWKEMASMYDTYGHRNYEHPYVSLTESSVHREDLPEVTEQKKQRFEQYYGLYIQVENEYIEISNRALRKLKRLVTEGVPKAEIIASLITQDTEAFVADEPVTTAETST